MFSLCLPTCSWRPSLLSTYREYRARHTSFLLVSLWQLWRQVSALLWETGKQPHLNLSYRPHFSRTSPLASPVCPHSWAMVNCGGLCTPSGFLSVLTRTERLCCMTCLWHSALAFFCSHITCSHHVDYKPHIFLCRTSVEPVFLQCLCIWLLLNIWPWPCIDWISPSLFTPLLTGSRSFRILGLSSKVYVVSSLPVASVRVQCLSFPKELIWGITPDACFLCPC